VSAIAGVVHYYWLVKSDIRWPLFYGGLVVLLFVYRAVAAYTPLLSQGRKNNSASGIIPNREAIQ
jgi:DMSO/TMAO reductase YedYZ heme-binding membrane subunit